MPDRALLSYMDAHASSQFRPAHALGDVDARARELGLTVAVKPWEGNSPDEQLHLVIAGLSSAKVAFLAFTDGEPLEIANVLVNLCFDVARGGPAHVGHAVKLADSPYLEAHGLGGALYLHPGTISYARRVANTPREGLSGWKLFLVVLITPNEYALAKRDTDLLFERFEQIDRDLMTVHAPFRIPG